MEEEGHNLAKASFGPTILLAIGKAYEGQAAIYLGGFFQGSLVSLRQEGHSIKSKVPLLLCCFTLVVTVASPSLHRCVCCTAAVGSVMATLLLLLLLMLALLHKAAHTLVFKSACIRCSELRRCSKLNHCSAPSPPQNPNPVWCLTARLPHLKPAHVMAQVHLAQMGLKVFQAQQKLEQMDKEQKQRSEAKARMNQQSSSPSAAPATAPLDQQPGEPPFPPMAPHPVFLQTCLRCWLVWAGS